MCFLIKQQEQIFRDKIYSELTISVRAFEVAEVRESRLPVRVSGFGTRLEIWVWRVSLSGGVGNIAIYRAKPLV